MKKTLVLSCALALAALSNTALAAEGQGFVRAEVGRSDVELTVDGFSEEDSYTSAGFGGGYWFNSYVGVEGNFAVLANEEVEQDVEVDLVSLGLGVVVKKNLGANNSGFFVGGRAGVSRVTLQVREDDFDVIDDEHSTKPYFGVNVGYDFNENWGLSLNYDRRQAEFEGVDVDVDSFSLGGEWRF